MREICFAYKNWECACLVEMDDNCGTTKCPFYKPKSKVDWVRDEENGEVVFREIRKVRV